MKKLLTAFAAVGVIGLSACAVEDEEPVIVDEPVIEEPAPAPTVEPAPMAEDTMMMMDSTMTDTTAM